MRLSAIEEKENGDERFGLVRSGDQRVSTAWTGKAQEKCLGYSRNRPV